MSDPKYAEIGSLEIRLIEECSELIKILCKVQRFGWNNSHPDNPLVQNWRLTLDEIADVERLCVQLKEALTRTQKEGV
jgi:hypothetical protein